MGCGADATQGLSAGWLDHYGAGLGGQSIDLEGVPPGRYRLVLDVDPEHRLLDRNERNTAPPSASSCAATARAGGGRGGRPLSFVRHLRRRHLRES